MPELFCSQLDIFDASKKKKKKKKTPFDIDAALGEGSGAGAVATPTTESTPAADTGGSVSHDDAAPTASLSLDDGKYPLSTIQWTQGH